MRGWLLAIGLNLAAVLIFFLLVAVIGMAMELPHALERNPADSQGALERFHRMSQDDGWRESGRRWGAASVIGLRLTYFHEPPHAWTEMSP